MIEIIYNCCNFRKIEKKRKGLGAFCYAAIKETFNKDTKKYQYEMIETHSYSCIKILNKKK